MLKLLVAFSIHLGSGAQPARAASASDPWFGGDKLKHFFTAAFVQSVAYTTLRATGVDNGPSLAGASAATVGVSVGKELWDRAGHGTPSVRDLTWDVAGAGVASVLLNRSR